MNWEPFRADDEALGRDPTSSARVLTEEIRPHGQASIINLFLKRPPLLNGLSDPVDLGGVPKSIPVRIMNLPEGLRCRDGLVCRPHDLIPPLFDLSITLLMVESCPVLLLPHCSAVLRRHVVANPEAARHRIEALIARLLPAEVAEASLVGNTVLFYF